MGEEELLRAVKDEIAMGTRPGVDSGRSTGIVDRNGVDRLFLEYYGLIEQPFGVTPDLRFLYLGAKHREALDVLNYGMELNRGFLTLIAKPGMGKTSLLFQYLEGLRDKARTVFLFQTDCDSTELMRYLLAELGLNGTGMDLQGMRALLSQVLLAEMEAGRRFVLVIDEAQNLDEKALESIRLLSNFETPWMKLIHIVLAGQPQLADRLAKPSMDQLRQRVSFTIRIEPFTREEVDLYINHRLSVAGYTGAPLFSIGARMLIAERSEGIPRIINNLCFCAMSYAWSTKRKTVDRDIIIKVLTDIDPTFSVAKVEKRNLSADVPEASKPNVLTTPQIVGSKMKPPPVRGGFSKFTIMCIVGFVLGWFGFQPDIQSRVGSTLSHISVAVMNFVVLTHILVSPEPVSVTGPEKTMTGPHAEGLSDVKDIQPAQDVGEESSSLSGGRN